MITMATLLFLNIYRYYESFFNKLLNITYVNIDALVSLCVLLDCFVLVGTILIVSEVRSYIANSTKEDKGGVL